MTQREVSARERITFPSRKTSFPIFTGDVADGWLQLLNLTLHCGTEKEAEDGRRLAEVLNALVTVELGEGNETVPEFFAVDSGALDEFHRRYWNDETAHAPQLERTVRLLRESPDARTGAVVLTGSGAPEMAADDGPIVSVSFHVVDGRLFGSFVLHSVDVYGRWPLVGSSLVRLQRDVARRVGVPVGSAAFVIHSTVLYDRDWKGTREVLERWFKRPLPLQVDPSGLFLFGADNGVARAMLLNHEGDRVLWEGAFENPEDLSWYIIDVMPWLLPQHIRYVGQECAALMRAIREGECYLQG